MQIQIKTHYTMNHVPLKYCIFCFRSDLEVEFSKEHIFPQSIGGTLFINEVCKICNSALGRYIDKEVLKLPDILDAFEKLNIPHNKSGITKNYYKITGIADDIQLPFIFKGKGYELVPHRLPDGSLILPEAYFEDELRKSIERDSNIKARGITEPQIEEEINRLKNDYKNAKPDEIIESALLGKAIKKRTNKFKFKYEPRSQAQVKRLIAKIFYEFLYLFGDQFVFEKANELNPLIDFIDRGTNNNTFSISRIKSKKEKYQPVHFTTFIFDEFVPRATIGFFGNIVYKIAYPIRSENFWTEFEKRYKVKEMKGIHFEQDIEERLKKFWLLFSDGSHKFAGAVK